MARFRRRSRRTPAAPRRSRRSSGSNSNGGLNVSRLALGGIAYGAARAHLSNLIAPVTRMLPLGNIADEVALFGAAYAAHKFVKNDMVRSIAKAAMTIEAAQIGNAVATGQLSLGGAASSGNVF